MGIIRTAPPAGPKMARPPARAGAKESKPVQYDPEDTKQHAEDARPTVRRASANPDSMRPDFDLVGEVTSSDARENLIGEKVISLYAYPYYLTFNLRRALSRGGPRAKWGIAMSCLVSYGVRRYYSSDDVQRFIATTQRVDRNDSLPAHAVEQIEMWKRGFQFSISDPTYSMGLARRTAFKAPEVVHNELFDLAGKLGISGSTLGIVCIMAGLWEQPGVIPEHAAYMHETVAKLDDLIKDRERRFTLLLKMVETGIWPP
jgi:hypothetical protein